jgi:hypothetical protein
MSTVNPQEPSLQAKFLSVLFGNHVTQDAAMQLYAFPQGGQWPKAKRFLGRTKAAEYAEANADKNIFFNCNLMAKGAKRGASEDARVVTTLYADIDTADGVHKTKPGEKLAAKEEVLAMLQGGTVVPVPSILIDSGGGYHTYWLLDAPIQIKSAEDQKMAEDLLLGLNNQIKAWHESKGCTYARLGDLARVLRVPGTFNHKTDPAKQVEIVWPKGVAATRYAVADVTFDPNVDGLPKPTTKVTGDLDAVGSDRAYAIAFGKCMKVPPEWSEDASGFVVRCCAQCVKSGCSADQTVEVLNAVRVIRDFPGDWTPEKIELRYKSALDKNELGARKTPPLYNFTTDRDPESGKKVVIAKLQSEVLGEFDELGLGLLSCRNELVDVSGDAPTVIAKDAQLFATMQRRTQVTWVNGGGCISKAEFFEAVKRHAKAVDDIDVTPHFPPIRGRHYTREITNDRDMSELEKFLDLFAPETEHDRQLLLAAVATVCWGGRPGKRPGFAIESAEADITGQIGTGKSTAAEMIASVPLLGKTGHMAIKTKADMDKVSSHMQDASTGSKRVVLIDNVKCLLAGEDLESLITSPSIDGHKLYGGYSERTNYFTIFVTGNFLRTSDDMSTRLVPIRIRRPVNDPKWERRRESIDYDKVLGGVAAFFDRPTQPLLSYTRWQLWEDEILSRCDKPDELCRLIADRSGKLSGVDEDAYEVREAIVRLLDAHTPDDKEHRHLYSKLPDGQDRYDASKDYVFIPSQRMPGLLEGFNGREKWTKKAAAMMVARLLKSDHLSELTKCSDTSKRGFVWQGLAATSDTPDYDRLSCAAHSY